MKFKLRRKRGSIPASHPENTMTHRGKRRTQKKSSGIVIPHSYKGHPIVVGSCELDRRGYLPVTGPRQRWEAADGSLHRRRRDALSEGYMPVLKTL